VSAHFVSPVATKKFTEPVTEFEHAFKNGLRKVFLYRRLLINFGAAMDRAAAVHPFGGSSTTENSSFKSTASSTWSGGSTTQYLRANDRIVLPATSTPPLPVTHTHARAVERAKYKAVAHQLKQVASVAPALAAFTGKNGGETTTGDQKKIWLGGSPPLIDADNGNAAVTSVPSSPRHSLADSVTATAEPNYNPVCPNMDKKEEGNHPFLALDGVLAAGEYDLLFEKKEHTGAIILRSIRENEIHPSTGGSPTETENMDGHKTAKERLPFHLLPHDMIVGDSESYNYCSGECGELLRPGVERWYCTDCLLAFCCTCVSASMKPPDVLALSPVLLKAAEMMSDTIGRKMLRNTGNGGDETEITEEPPEAEHGIAKFRTAGKAIMAGHQIQSLYKKSLQRHLNIVSDGESDDTLVDTDLMNIAIPKCKYKHPVAVQENTNRFSTCAGCNKTLVPRLERFYCSVCNKDYCSCCIHKSIIRDGDAPANDMIVEKCFNVSWCCEAWNQSLIAGVTAFATIMLILIVVVISGNL